MRHGDSDDDFRSFVADRSTALLRLAYLVSADRAAAEDVLQTALVRAYLRWSKISSQPEAYVRRVIVTVAIDEHRRTYRRWEVSAERVPDIADPTEQFESLDVSTRLRAALRALPARQRAAVVLRHWVGLDPSDAAELLNCTAETVRSQAMRGLAKLRAAYAPESEQTDEPGR